MRSNSPKHVLSCLILLVLSSFLCVSLESKTKETVLDEICMDAISGKSDIETRITRYASSYLKGRVEVAKLGDLQRIKKKKTLYIISGSIDLKGATISLPDNCLIFFRDGSSFKNGTLTGLDTRIVSRNQPIFKKGRSTYRGYLKGNNYQYIIRRDGALIIGGTWSNKTVGSLWTDLKTNDAANCQALALNNLISLYSKDVVAYVPKGVYYVYDWVRVLSRSVDFQGTEIRSIDFDVVEDKSISLPAEAKPTSLQSRYGLIDFNAKNSFLKNLTIDGRSTSRKETPKLGSQCLITISKGSDAGLFENVIVKNAVDCDICTGSISGFTFRNVIFGPCGEHGFYTHAYAGDLVFENCQFIDCGQSPELYTKRGGISGCVRGAASRDFSPKQMASLRASFSNCSFTNSGVYDVATIYTDIPKADFHNCKWEGKVVGYISNNPSFNEETGQMYEYNFYNCDNPCGAHNAKNTIRKLIGCTNVRNPFENTYQVEDCSIIICYDDADNRYEGRFSSEIKRPVVFKNCVFTKISSEDGIRSTIINPRPMSFESCSWTVSEIKAKEKGQSLLFLKDKKGQVTSAPWIKFQDCSFNIPGCRLITCCDTDVSFQGGEFKDSYDVLVLGEKTRPNRVKTNTVRMGKRKEISRY